MSEKTDMLFIFLLYQYLSVTYTCK